jgi:hypothetical protein
MNRNADDEERVIGIAWYRPEQWERLRRISSDADELEETYEEWLRVVSQKSAELVIPGVSLRKVDVDVNELLIWCGMRNLPVDGTSRARFVAEKLQTMFEKLR